MSKLKRRPWQSPWFVKNSTSTSWQEDSVGHRPQAIGPQ